MIKLINFLLLLLFLIAKCHPPDEMLSLKIDHNGQQLTVSPNQEIFLTLEANPTTGYTWEVIAFDTTILKQIQDIQFKPQSQLLGAPGEQSLRFRAQHSGKTLLTLKYHRPWEKDSAPLKTYSVEIIVQK